MCFYISWSAACLWCHASQQTPLRDVALTWHFSLLAGLLFFHHVQASFLFHTLCFSFWWQPLLPLIKNVFPWCNASGLTSLLALSFFYFLFTSFISLDIDIVWCTGKNRGFRFWQRWTRNQGPSLSIDVTLGNYSNLSEHQFSYLQNWEGCCQDEIKPCVQAYGIW